MSGRKMQMRGRLFEKRVESQMPKIERKRVATRFGVPSVGRRQVQSEIADDVAKRTERSDRKRRLQHQGPAAEAED